MYIDYKKFLTKYLEELITDVDIIEKIKERITMKLFTVQDIKTILEI